jgi:hypothetical protein
VRVIDGGKESLGGEEGEGWADGSEDWWLGTRSEKEVKGRREVRPSARRSVNRERRRKDGKESQNVLPFPCTHSAIACAATTSLPATKSTLISPSFSFCTTTTAGWSCKFSPTPGRSIRGVMPCDARKEGEPIPESSRSWGVWMVPVERTISSEADWDENEGGGEG